MNFLKKNWAIVLIAVVTLLLGTVTLLTVLRIGQEKPVAPTAPESKPKAVGGEPVPACQVSFTVTISPPSPTPSPEVTPTPNPFATPSPSPTPLVTPQPTPSATPLATPLATPPTTPLPTPQVTPSPTPGVGGGAPNISVEKLVDRTTAVAGDTLTYTVRIKNTGTVTGYDVYFDENLSDFTDYKAPSMACTFTSTGTGATNNIGFEIDDLQDGFDETPDAESATLDRFRVAGDLTENANTWDLAVNDYITCTYKVTVNSTVTGGTTIINLVTGHIDDKNGNQTGENDYQATAQTTVTVPSPYCGYSCNSNSQCPTDLICYIAAGQTTGACRNPACQTDTDCVCAGPIASVTPAPSIIPQVPVAGVSWPTIFLIMGGMALLVLGFALP